MTCNTCLNGGRKLKKHNRTKRKTSSRHHGGSGNIQNGIISNCNPNNTIYNALGMLACGTARSSGGGSKRRRKYRGTTKKHKKHRRTNNLFLKGGQPRWPAPFNPAPPHPLPSVECRFPNFTPLVLSQFGGTKKKSRKHNKRSR